MHRLKKCQTYGDFSQVPRYKTRVVIYDRGAFLRLAEDFYSITPPLSLCLGFFQRLRVRLKAAQPRHVSTIQRNPNQNQVTKFPFPMGVANMY